jgi:tRNA G18 (ribose-2'-O)-methylase SpoU
VHHTIEGTQILADPQHRCRSVSTMNSTPPPPIRIDDVGDERLADYVALNDPVERTRRERDEFFITEGPVALVRLLESGHTIRSVVLLEQRYERFAPLLVGLDAPVYLTSLEVLRATVGFDLHRGVVAAAQRRPLASVADLCRDSFTIGVLEGLNDPENLGAIARSARAFGVDGLLIDPTCMDPYARRTVRVSMGEILMLRVARATDWPSELEVLHAAGFSTWAMTPAAGAVSLWDLDTPERLAFVFGAEGPGLAPSTLERCTQRVRIPLADQVDSLNVAAAAAVGFADRARRSNQNSGAHGRLTH